MCVTAAAPLCAADRIFLRDLNVINDRTVVKFDEDGVRLDNGKTITWDEIEQARVAKNQQEFDRMLKELGNHLYRIRLRLKSADYPGLLSHAEAVYPRYASRRSPTAYMVWQGLMWGYLSTGRQEQALEPYLRCCEYLRWLGTAKLDLPGERRLRLDRRTGISPELPPVWFDAAAAKKALPGVEKTINAMKQPAPPGAWIYLATLALAAGEEKTSRQALDQIKGGSEEIDHLRDIAMAQWEVLSGTPGESVRKLDRAPSDIPQQNKALALYWRGRAKAAATESAVKDQGLLLLLRLPAIHGEQFPQLAAAGLYQSMEVLARAGHKQASAACRKELLRSYGQTYHAAKVKAKLNPRAGDE